MELQITQPERELMVEILSHRYRELLHEVSKTSSRDFKSLLKEDEKVIEGLLLKLKQEVCKN